MPAMPRVDGSGQRKQVEVSTLLEIETGAVSGFRTSDGRVVVYRGIPYAASPVGNSRWKPPQPATSWSGTLSANRFGSAPMQPLHHRNALMAQFGFAEPPECGLSEDCLFLNVWAPATATETSRLPVIVWIYGGGFRVGSGSHPVSWGNALAGRDVVVVSLNYRTGGLGFLAHPELTAEMGASGNYGCLDVMAGLGWVQRNISAFGGNPDCVTLFGQSAGAAISSVLLMSAATTGLFHRIILHSAGRAPGGPMGQLRSLAEAERQGETWVAQQNARSLSEMRNLPADATYGSRGFWNIIRDGQIVTDDSQQRLAKGQQAAVPMLCGFTRNEATPYPYTELHGVHAFRRYAQETMQGNADEFLSLFPHSDDAESIASSYEVRRAVSFAYQPWKLAKMHSTIAPVFLFEFDRAVPVNPSIFHEPPPAGGFGAYHGSELWYVFNTFGAQRWNWTAVDRNLAETMADYWTNFARNGDPNGPSLPVWPRFESARGEAMLLGAAARAGIPSNLAALRLFERHFST